ncbi:MAG: acyltransferase [Gammaproteobacteria bacterium]
MTGTPPVRTRGGKELHIPSLDGIRAFAAMWVFAAHAGFKHLVPGGFGVTIFFFLSGYLITTLLRLEHQATGTISLKKFYLRRIYRILPPMYIVLLVTLGISVSGLAPGNMTWGAVLAQFAHLTNYYLALYGNEHLIPNTALTWSLAVEEHFYLLYPLALWTLLKRGYSDRQIAGILLGTCAAVLIWRCILVFGVHIEGDWPYVATDARLDSLLFGCIMGVWLNPALDSRQLKLGTLGALALIAAAIAVELFSFRFGIEMTETFGYSLQGIALFPLFYCAVRYNQWPLFRWLSFRPVRALGIISYSFYLIHTSALHVTAHHLGVHSEHRVIVIGWVCAAAFATAMYFLVERPLAGLRRRLHTA